MIWLLYLVCGVAAAYQLTALVAVVRHLVSRERSASRFPQVSIFKPMHGLDPFFEQAIGSHARIDYPDYELLFGVNRPGDEAISAVQRLRSAHPRLHTSLHVSHERTPNGKVGTLIELARHAAGELLVVNDGDIHVPPDYLRRIVAPLEDPNVGVVTCLYRPAPRGWPALWEALGIVADFAPSTLVAPLVGVKEFGLGATLCFRAEDLRRIGGFEAVAEYLADDYQLARRLTRDLGKRATMSKLIVDSAIGYDSWRGVWKHQLRWARTIRVSRGDGYLGLPVTHAGLWALAAALSGAWLVAAGLVVLRMLTGLVAGAILMRSPVALALPLIPLWDLWAFCVWLAGLGGDTIEWRGIRMRLARDGRLTD
ncbi:MAG: glycosyltransferase [Acidobacteria bacterium]|nr:glycosyltransferase [Acidobacteriota bacterium]